MELSNKVAVISSLAFIGGMSWLVSQVARPVVELPSPLVVAATEAVPSIPVAVVADAQTPRQLRPTVLAASSPVRPRQQAPARDPLPAAPEALEQPAPLLAAGTLPPPVIVTGDEVIVADAAVPLDEPQSPPTEPAGASAAAVASAETRPGGVVEAPADVPVAVVREHSGPLMLAAVAAPAPGATPEPTPANPPAPVTYTVRKGDTLVKIMRRCWNSDDPALLEALLAANPRIAARRDRIFPGDVLTIPDITVARAAATEAARQSSQVQWYTVRKRDSLASIARRMLNDEGRWREIAALNGLRNAHRIRPGERIKLPPRRSDT